MKTVGERIRFIREQENITIAKFASGLRTYYANLMMIENGTKEPTVRLINMLHDMFPQYSLEWILYGIGDCGEKQFNVINMNNLCIAKQIEQYLYQLNVKAELEEPGIYGFDISMENTMLSVRIICDQHEKRVMLFGEAPFNIPKNKLNDVLNKLNDIHQHEYNTAHCFINTENEHLMSQVILNLDSNNHMDYDVFRYGLCDVCYIIDNYYKKIMQVLVNIDPARIAIGMPKKNKLFK